MQLRIDRDAMELMRSNENIRKAVAALYDPNYQNEWSRRLPDNGYELAVDNMYVQWWIDRTGMETVIKVSVVTD